MRVKPIIAAAVAASQLHSGSHAPNPSRALPNLSSRLGSTPSAHSFSQHLNFGPIDTSSRLNDRFNSPFNPTSDLRLDDAEPADHLNLPPLLPTLTTSLALLGGDDPVDESEASDATDRANNIDDRPPDDASTPEVRVKLCVYKGRSWHSQGQAFLKLERDNQPPLTIGLAPTQGKAHSWSHSSGRIKNCNDYLQKNNVKYIDLNLNNEQITELLSQVRADSGALGQGQEDALTTAQVDAFAQGFELTPRYRSEGLNQGFNRQFNSVHYLSHLLSGVGDVDLPVLNGRPLLGDAARGTGNRSNSPKKLWQQLDQIGYTHPTPGGLPAAQSLTFKEFITTHLFSNRSRSVTAEMARQSMDIMKAIREDLQKTFLDPEITTLDVDIDLLNRAAEFLDRFANHLDTLSAITAYGFQKMAGRPDPNFYRPTGEVTINADSDPEQTPVRVKLCSYPARSAHKEGQAFLTFSVGGQDKFAVSLAPESGRLRRLSGLTNGLPGGRTAAHVVDASHQLGKKAARSIDLNLSQAQIQQLMGQINADAVSTGSTLRINNIGGITPVGYAGPAVNGQYRSAMAGKLARSPSNNSVDYMRRLLSNIGHDLTPLNGANSPRALAAQLPDHLRDTREGDLLDPQSLTLREGLNAFTFGLRHGLPNMLNGVEAGVESLADNIEILSNVLGLVEDDGVQSPFWAVRTTQRVTEMYNTLVAGTYSAPGFREYAQNNIQTIDRLLLTLSCDFQIIAGRDVTMPNNATETPYPEAEPIRNGRETFNVIRNHRTVIPQLLQSTMLHRLALTESIRTRLAQPLNHFNATVGQGESSLGTVTSSFARAPTQSYNTANNMRREMAQGARESQGYLGQIGAAIQPALDRMKH